MKRSPLRRKAPRRVARRVGDRDYLHAVHNLACCVCGTTDRIQANHAGIKPGMGLKCSDRETIPMCHVCHGEWTDHIGRFRGWTKSERREWADARIRETQEALAQSST